MLINFLKPCVSAALTRFIFIFADIFTILAVLALCFYFLFSFLSYGTLEVIAVLLSIIIKHVIMNGRVMQWVYKVVLRGCMVSCAFIKNLTHWFYSLMFTAFV